MCSIISGVVTSLVTPFTTHLADGLRRTEPDPFAFEASIRWQARAGIAGVAVAGWAGEGPTLTRAERSDLIRLAAGCGKSMAVLAHVGEPSTARAVALARDAVDAGADALVLSLPFYNKPTFAGIHRHVEAVAGASRVPLLVECDPARTNLFPTAPQLAALMRLPGVAGLVDHTAHPLPIECMSAAPGRSAFFAAHEATGHAAALLGADGLFSAVANCALEAVVRLWTAGRTGDGAAARTLAARLAPLVRAVDADGAPALKHALGAACGMEPAVRLPLHRASEAADRGGAGSSPSVLTARRLAGRGCRRMSVALSKRAGRMDFVLERIGRSCTVRGLRDRCGGLFASREAALAFVRREAGALCVAKPYRPPGTG